MIGLLGIKLGMTHVYDEYGRSRAVTAVQGGPCTILALREPGRHGYRAAQMGFRPIPASKVNAPRRGEAKKNGLGPFRYVQEFRLPEGGDWKVGQQLTVDLFQPYELVDVTGVSIGKGFQGGVKRWGWSGGPATHGSMSHRAPGSIGASTFPARVFKGHHLPGHMGHRRVTVQHLRIAQIDPEHHLLLLEGAVPGPAQGLVAVRKALKRPGVIKKPVAILVVEEQETGPKGKGRAKAKAAAAKT